MLFYDHVFNTVYDSANSMVFDSFFNFVVLALHLYIVSVVYLAADTVHMLGIYVRCDLAHFRGVSGSPSTRRAACRNFIGAHVVIFCTRTPAL